MTPAADLDTGIRERAYQLWEAAGRPDGCDLEHWLQAEALVVGTAAVETPAAKPKRARKVVEPEAVEIEPAKAAKPAKAKKAKAIV